MAKPVEIKVVGTQDAKKRKKSYRTELPVWGAPLPSVGLNKSDHFTWVCVLLSLAEFAEKSGHL